MYIYGGNDPAIAVTQSGNRFISNSVNATQPLPTRVLLASGGPEFVLGGTVQSTADTFTINSVDTTDSAPPSGASVGRRGRSARERVAAGQRGRVHRHE